MIYYLLGVLGAFALLGLWPLSGWFAKKLVEREKLRKQYGTPKKALDEIFQGRIVRGSMIPPTWHEVKMTLRAKAVADITTSALRTFDDMHDKRLAIRRKGVEHAIKVPLMLYMIKRGGSQTDLDDLTKEILDNVMKEVD